MERKVQVGSDSGLFVLERARNQSYLLTAANESGLEYTLTLNFEASRNLRFVPKNTAVEALPGPSFRVVLPPGQAKKLLTAGVVDVNQPFELLYSTTVAWRAAPQDQSSVPRAREAVEELMNGVTDPALAVERCRASGTPFVDMQFPPVWQSVGQVDGVVWRRPEEFLARAAQHLFGSTPPEPRQILPGAQRRGRFLSCLAALAERPEIVLRCLPEQWTDLALGVVKLLSCNDGYWNEVIVDSYLPCDGATELPLYVHAKNAGVWPTVVEKAYAKLWRSYQRLADLDLPSLLLGFTGFPCTRLKLGRRGVPEEEAWGTLRRWVEAGDLVVCTAPSDQTKEGDDLFPIEDNNFYSSPATLEALGLLPDHHYAVLDARLYQDERRLQHPVRLVKLRNPGWATTEWAGAWGPGWDGWAAHSKRELNYEQCWAEGSFWISFSDLRQHFASATACHHRPLWRDFRVQGAFLKDRAADVCFEFHQRESGPVQFILTQPNAATSRKSGYRYLHCALFVLKPCGSKYDLHAFSEFCAARQVFVNTDLPADSRPYVVVPVSFECGRTQPFTLTAISPTLEPEDVQLKSGVRDLEERCELLACRQRGAEVIIHREQSARILRAGRVVIVAAQNAGREVWPIHFDFRELKGWTSHNLYNQVGDIQMEIPGGHIRFVETFFNASNRLDNDFIYTFSDSPPTTVPPFVPPSFACLEEGPIILNSSLLRIVCRLFQFEGEVVDRRRPVVSLASSHPYTTLAAGGRSASTEDLQPVSSPTLPSIPSGHSLKASDALRSPPATGLPALSPTSPSLTGSSAMRSPVLAAAARIGAGECEEDWSRPPVSEEQLRRQFDCYDRFNNGFLWRSEFRREYQKLDRLGVPVPKAVLDELFSRFDTGDDRLEFDEFCLIMLQRARW